MVYQKLEVTHSSGQLSFTTRDDNARPWWRDLDLSGEPLYRIGNLCDTCGAIFGRFENDKANQPLTPPELSQRLREGFDSLDQAIVDTVASILPKGKYVIGLFEVIPSFLELSTQGRKDDYVLWENMMPVSIPIELWPEVPRNIPYWYSRPKPKMNPWKNENFLYECVLPIVGQSDFDKETIKSYEQAFNMGKKTTCLAFSLVDVRYISGGRALDWRLVHILLDGHHKVMDASNVKKPISILSFLALDESFAGKEWIDHTVKYRYEA